VAGSTKTAGVLALQGDFEAHAKALSEAGARVLEVRTVQDLDQCDGLVIPGGESTTMLKLLDEEHLTEPLKEFAAHKPLYGSCAGAILLATEVSHPQQPSLGILDIAVERNAYGRQINSRIANVTCEDGHAMEAVFIRAPIIRRVGSAAHTLASYKGHPIWVEQGRHMVTTFHPELSMPSRVHQRFIEKLSE
jgi:pyridoxal 5'-phosphate synthase pdxT subunit